jgi:hypothetical protein
MDGHCFYQADTEFILSCRDVQGSEDHPRSNGRDLTRGRIIQDENGEGKPRFVNF